MNAPEAVVHSAAQNIPLISITPSRTNPRKRFDDVQLAELTESVRQHGVLQPILVRIGSSPKDPKIGWEVVAGERRYRAAKAAGLEEIPAVVRDLTDVQALELQCIENLQRADLHPLEEAEGYDVLMKRHKYTSDDIAAKVGKSRGYVYGRLKLIALCRKARDAFFAGKLDASHALLLARIPVESVQLEAMREVCRGDDGNAIPYRAAADIVHRRFMLRLAEAPFNVKDPDLVKIAGACGDCPKRTGNQPELFADVKSADVCTDPTCFAGKKSAHYDQIRIAAEASGKKVITGEAAKKLAPYHDHHLQSGFSRVDGDMYIDGKNQKVSTLVKKLGGISTSLLESPHSHDIIEIVNTGALQAALKHAGLVKTTPTETATRQNASQAREREKRKADVTHRQRVFDALCSRLTQAETFAPEDGVLVALGVWDLSDYETRAALTTRWGWLTANAKKADWSDLEKAKPRIAALKPVDLWRLMIELVCFPDVAGHSKSERLMPTATRYEVDITGIRKDIDAAAKSKKVSKKKPAPKPKKTALAKSKKTGAP